MKTEIEMAIQSGFWREHTDTWMCSTNGIQALVKIVRADEAAKWAKTCGRTAIRRGMK